MLQSESSPYISTEKYSGTLPYSHLSNMVTSLLQPQPYFFLQKTLANTSTVNTTNGHILKSKNSRIFYNFTLLIWPLARNFEYWNACDVSIPICS